MYVCFRRGEKRGAAYHFLWQSYKVYIVYLHIHTYVYVVYLAVTNKHTLSRNTPPPLGPAEMGEKVENNTKLVQKYFTRNVCFIGIFIANVVVIHKTLQLLLLLLF